MPAEGDPAPELVLPDDSGTQRNLVERRGQWTIVYFYPKDDTPGCTVEACEFRDSNVDFTRRDAEVWGVSVLGSGSKQRFKAKFDLNFVLLADEDHAAAERWGTWVEKNRYGRKYMGIGRATFLVDPDGRIARRWLSVKPEGHAAEVLAALDAALSKQAPAGTR